MSINTDPTPRLHKLLLLAFSICGLAVAVVTSAAQAQTAETQIRGMPDVIDADILKFGQQRVIRCARAATDLLDEWCSLGLQWCG
jgi:hypothetical protein